MAENDTLDKSLNRPGRGRFDQGLVSCCLVRHKWPGLRAIWTVDRGSRGIVTRQDGGVEHAQSSYIAGTSSAHEIYLRHGDLNLSLNISNTSS